MLRRAGIQRVAYLRRPLPMRWECFLQIGLVDMLKEEYGIEPAGMLGHSAGEIACGYADGCLTREQTILIAYHRGESVTGTLALLLTSAIPRCRPLPLLLRRTYTDLVEEESECLGTALKW